VQTSTPLIQLKTWYPIFLSGSRWSNALQYGYNHYVTQPILKTKIFIPAQRPDIVARPHLIKKLSQGFEAQLTLISAPAGFGKTTLVSEFLNNEHRYPAAWLSLDIKDNDVTRFLSHLAASLGTFNNDISASVLSLLQLNQLPAPSIILTSLINELIATLSTPFVLYLDDYHVITSPVVHKALIFLIDHLPPQMHLTIITREDPPLPLARLRAHNQLTEIRAKDLRFSHREAAVFLNQVMGLNLSMTEITTLETRTEGWIAGLQMAAISMRGREDITGFLRTFANSNRFIFDYLIEEVLEQQSSEIQDFLIQTSILDRMCAPLCNTIIGKDDGQRILLQLDQMNLFVVSLDDQRRWYRYHHLFIDLLRQKLRISYNNLIPGLHHKACEWYQENQLIGEAIHHALAIDDHEKVAALIEKSVIDVIASPELLTLAGWLSKLPDELLHARPWLSVAYARILIRTYKFDQAELHLENVDHSLANQAIPQRQKKHIQSYAAAIRAYLAMLKGNVDQVIPWARQSVQLLPEEEKRFRGMVLSLLGTSLQRVGKFDQAEKALVKGIACSKAAGDLQNTIEVYGDLAGFFVERGQLHEAFSICQEAFEYVESSFQRGGRVPVGAAHIHFRISTILRHWNNLESSLWHAKKAIEINQQWGFESRLSLINLAIALQAAGNQEDAMGAIQGAEAIAIKESEFWVMDVKSVRALLWLDQGNLDAAAKWAKEIGVNINDEIPFQKQRIYLSLAQVYLAQGQQGDIGMLDKALQLLLSLQTLLEGASAQAYVIQILVLQALAYQAQGKVTHALAAIDQALSLGEPGGYIRTFVRGGAPMKKLLERAERQEMPHPFTKKLIKAFNSTAHEVVHQERSAINDWDSLTKREKEVLRLLDTNLSVPEIADELVVTKGTLRTHIKRIYNKLNVHSRFEAVTRAKEIHLL